jgi:hypothetical protein
MKLGTLVNSRMSLSRLIQNSLPLQMGWNLRMLVKQVEPELKIYDDLKIQKIKELGKEIAPNKWGVNPENEETYILWEKEFFENEIKIDVKQIKFSEILNYKNIQGQPIEISANDLSNLDWLIIE